MSRSTDDGVVPFHFAVAALALGSLQSHLTRLKKMVIGTKASKPQKKRLSLILSVYASWLRLSRLAVLGL